MEKRWRCTVCGYIHTGDQPPEICPVCRVDASKFELISEPEPDVEPETRVDQIRKQALTLFAEMKASFVPHAVAAHFPNALLPTCFLFLVLYIVRGLVTFEATVFYLLVVAALAVPPTFVTGLLDWKKEYSGELTPIFRKKICLGILLFVLGLVAASWRWSNPDLLISGGFSACAYSLLILAMLGCVMLLGHYGGMLVFAKRKKEMFDE